MFRLSLPVRTSARTPMLHCTSGTDGRARRSCRSRLSAGRCLCWIFQITATRSSSKKLRARSALGYGLRLLGTDAPSVDRKESRGLEVHRTLFSGNASILENLDLRRVV